MTLAPLGRVLKDWVSRWRRLVAAPLILAALVGIATIFLPTRWTSSALLEFPPLPSALDLAAGLSQAGGGGGGGMLSALTGQGDQSDRYIAIIKSYRIRNEVAEKVPLGAIWPGMNHPDLMDTLADCTRVKSQPGELVYLEATVPGPNRVAMLLGADVSVPAQTSTKLADAYVARLQEYLASVSASHERSERAYIEPQVARAIQDLDDLQARRTALLRSGPALAPSEEHLLVTGGIGTLETALTTANAQLFGARREVVKTRSEAAGAPPSVLASIQQSRTPEVDRLQALLTDARARLYVLRQTQGMSDRHPDVRRELDGISQLETKLAAAVARPLDLTGRQMGRNSTYDALLQAYSLAVVKEASLTAQAHSLEKVRNEMLSRLRRLSPREVRQLRLEAEYKEQWDIYALLRKALEEAKIREQATADVCVVMDPPRVPDRKSGPSMLKNAAIAMLIGIVLCLILVELSNRLCTRAIGVEHAAPQEESPQP